MPIDLYPQPAKLFRGQVRTHCSDWLFTRGFMLGSCCDCIGYNIAWYSIGIIVDWYISVASCASIKQQSAIIRCTAHVRTWRTLYHSLYVFLHSSYGRSVLTVVCVLYRYHGSIWTESWSPWSLFIVLFTCTHCYVYLSHAMPMWLAIGHGSCGWMAGWYRSLYNVVLLFLRDITATQLNRSHEVHCRILALTSVSLLLFIALIVVLAQLNSDVNELVYISSDILLMRFNWSLLISIYL